MTELRKRGAAIARKAWAGVTAHRRSLDVLLPLLGVILIIDIMTFSAGFGGNDDPGTYTAQAWAVLNRGELAHYTYWYDHPPVGWLQIALYAWLTNGFGRSDIDVLMASELMVIAQLVSCVLIFMFMRRRQFNRAFALLAVALFALNPLAIQYQKMAFLDNLAVVWMLASMVFAVSPRRSLGAAFGSGLCLAIATLTKETSAVWLVVVLYLLWQNYSQGHRKWGIAVFTSAYVGVGALYLLYAVLKGELLPGPGHVSLWGSFIWQLGRSGGYDVINTWLDFDRILLYLTIPAVPVGLAVRRTRPVAVGFVVMCLILARGGYIPAPYVIGMLPFAALLVAGALGSVWPGWSRMAQSTQRKLTVVFRRSAVGMATVAIIAMSAPSWAQAAQNMSPRDEVWYYSQAIEWIERNVPKDAVIAVDDNMWVDLTDLGYTNVVWFYKLDLDPAIKEKYVPDAVGYKGIDYVVLKSFYWAIADDVANSVVIQARDHGQGVAEFGNGDRRTGPIVAPYQIYRTAK